jgi:cobalamin biosynthesis Co2+ chelatase CbiK
MAEKNCPLSGTLDCYLNNGMFDIKNEPVIRHLEIQYGGNWEQMKRESEKQLKSFEKYKLRSSIAPIKDDLKRIKKLQAYEKNMAAKYNGFKLISRCFSGTGCPSESRRGDMVIEQFFQ